MGRPKDLARDQRQFRDADMLTTAQNMRNRHQIELSKLNAPGHGSNPDEFKYWRHIGAINSLDALIHAFG